MPFTLQQEQALKAIRAWARDQTTAQQVFTMTGPAGTGKTSLLPELVDALPGLVACAAFTGKAASVMAAKGCVGATTLHRLLYRPVVETDAQGARRLRFERNTQGEAAIANVIIVDEASMVGPQLARDLLSFGKKVLAIGDPGQLPPVDGNAYFMQIKPNVRLTEVHRQALDSPIIWLATQVREGKYLKPGRYGESEVVTPKGVDARRILSADQVLVGTNALRLRLTRRFRQLRGVPADEPIVGDRLVCLRNNCKKGLFNGCTFIVTDVLDPHADGTFRLKVQPEADSGLRPDFTRRIDVRPECFRGEETRVSPTVIDKTDHFTFAQALTVHKAQGSQWSDVALFDESPRFGRDVNTCLLYTGLTRASERVTVVMQPTR